ncbi:MAG: FecR domain-containing protein, partial [Oligoflexia bacterium]|nr:FecR domain-containing protein [Oligoflexia bacterium]
MKKKFCHFCYCCPNHYWNYFFLVVVCLMINVAFWQQSLLPTLQPAFSAESGDYKIDPKTSKATPNFIGEVILLKGRVVKVESVGKMKDILLMEGQKLYQNDLIKTNKKSLVKLQMVDDTTIVLGENSQLDLKKFEFKNKQERSSIYQIVKGQVRALFKNKVNSP